MLDCVYKDMVWHTESLKMASAHCVDQVNVCVLVCISIYLPMMHMMWMHNVTHALHGGSSSGMRDYLQSLQVSTGLMLNMTAQVALDIVCCNIASCHWQLAWIPLLHVCLMRDKSKQVWDLLLAFHKVVWCADIALFNQNLHTHSVTCRHFIKWNRASICEALDPIKTGHRCCQKGQFQLHA